MSFTFKEWQLCLVIAGSLLTIFGAVVQWKDKSKSESKAKQIDEDRKKLSAELIISQQKAIDVLEKVQFLQKEINSKNNEIFVLNKQLLIEQTGGDNEPILKALTEEPNIGYLSEYWFEVVNKGNTPVYDISLTITKLRTHPKYYNRKFTKRELYFIKEKVNYLNLGTIGRNSSRDHVFVTPVGDENEIAAYYVELIWRHGQKSFHYEFGINPSTQRIEVIYSREMD